MVKLYLQRQLEYEKVEDEEDEKSLVSAFVNPKNNSLSCSNAVLKFDPKVNKEVKTVKKKKELDGDLEKPSSKNSFSKLDSFSLFGCFWFMIIPPKFFLLHSYTC